MNQKFTIFKTTKEKCILIFSFLMLSTFVFGQITHTSVLSGLTGASGMTKDSSGNIYVATYSSTGTVVKMDSSGNVLNTFTGFAYPVGVAVDTSGNIYVVEKLSPNIVKMDSSGANRQNFNIGFDMSQPNGICVDGNGKLYVTSAVPTSGFGDQKILKMNVDGTGKQFIGPNTYGAVTTIALNNSGNKIYIREGGRVRRLNLDGTNEETLLSSGASGVGLALDASDNVYITDGMAWELKKINGSNNAVSTIYNNLSFAYVVIDNSGNLFFNTSSGSDINKIVNTSLSTQNISSTRFSLSPNPAQDFTVLNGVKKGAKISVYDLSGKLLLSTIATESQFTINTTSFTKGVYMVKVDNESVKLVVSK